MACVIRDPYWQETLLQGVSKRSKEFLGLSKVRGSDCLVSHIVLGTGVAYASYSNDVIMLLVTIRILKQLTFKTGQASKR